MAYAADIGKRLEKNGDTIEVTFQGDRAAGENTNDQGYKSYRWYFDDVQGEDGVVLWANNSDTNASMEAIGKKGLRAIITRTGKYDFRASLISEVQKQAEEVFGGDNGEDDFKEVKTTHDRNVASNKILNLAKERGFSISYAKDLVVAGKVKITEMLETAETMADYMAHGIQRPIEEKDLGLECGTPAGKELAQELLELLWKDCMINGVPSPKMAQEWIQTKLQHYYSDSKPWGRDPDNIIEELSKEDTSCVLWMKGQV